MKGKHGAAMLTPFRGAQIKGLAWPKTPLCCIHLVGNRRLGLRHAAGKTLLPHGRGSSPWHGSPPGERGISAWSYQPGHISLVISAWSYQPGHISLVISAWSYQPGHISVGHPLVAHWLGFDEKEVIQPHLPVRLPCYDFTPVTSSALGISPPGAGFCRRSVTLHSVIPVVKATDKLSIIRIELPPLLE